MARRIATVFIGLGVWLAVVVPGWAQSTVWIQVEAHRTLAEAQDRVSDFAAELQAVNGFRMRQGWYAIALGPFSQADAERQIARLKASGAIPRDSYINYSSQYRQQFWPVGANALAAAPVNPVDPGTQAAATTEVAAVTPPPPPPPPPSDETRAEALASERDLDRDARMALQVALRYEGFYNSGIDGAFGPGTRRAMSDYQVFKNYEDTGVLTTKQRTEILASYQAVIDSLNMQVVRDDGAGIEIAMPAAMVEFDRYEAPFAHYDAVGDGNVRVVLISQSGTQDTLFGLYDILQTLEIVPLEGPRERRRSDFTIEGSDGDITSYTYARLVDDAVKGFTLIWPAGDEKRRDLALDEMKASFTSIEGNVLADSAGLDEAVQSLDLLSGLEIRQPDRARSGFYVDPEGVVVTTAAAVANCQRITLDDSQTATVLATDPDLGLAILKPDAALAPLAVARLLTGEPHLKSDIAVAGYTFGGRLSAPTLTFGTLADLKGLDNEAHLTRLAMVVQDGDAGGPVMDAGGAVLGLLLDRADPDGRQLPVDVNFALNSGALAAFLAENGVTPEATDPGAALHPVDLTTMAADMTVLVSCWN